MSCNIMKANREQTACYMLQTVTLLIPFIQKLSQWDIYSKWNSYDHTEIFIQNKLWWKFEQRKRWYLLNVEC